MEFLENILSACHCCLFSVSNSGLLLAMASYHSSCSAFVNSTVSCVAIIEHKQVLEQACHPLCQSACPVGELWKNG